MEEYEGLAEIYDAWSDEDYDAWGAFTIAFLEKHGHPRCVADICCGTANITLPLLRKGWQVTGVDRSREMLSKAAEKLRENGFAKTPLICQDITNLQLPTQDAIVCACDGFNYLLTPDDVRKALRRIRECLRPDGLLMFDISSFYKLQSVLGDSFFAQEREEGAYVWQNRYNPKTRICTMDFSFFGEQNRIREIHKQRAHTQWEMTQLLEETGFEVIDVVGHLKTTPPQPKEMRIHFIARRT